MCRNGIGSAVAVIVAKMTRPMAAFLPRFGGGGGFLG